VDFIVWPGLRQKNNKWTGVPRSRREFGSGNTGQIPETKTSRPPPEGPLSKGTNFRMFGLPVPILRGYRAGQRSGPGRLSPAKLPHFSFPSQPTLARPQCQEEELTTASFPFSASCQSKAKKVHKKYHYGGDRRGPIRSAPAAAFDSLEQTRPDQNPADVLRRRLRLRRSNPSRTQDGIPTEVSCPPEKARELPQGAPCRACFGPRFRVPLLSTP